MRKLCAVFLRLTGLFRRRRCAREFDDELESYLQTHIEDNLRTGMSVDDAGYVVLPVVGNVKQIGRGNVGAMELCLA
jgi:hypothetical protein